MKRFLRFNAVLLAAACIAVTPSAAFAGTVSSRLNEVRKEYPAGSRIPWVTVSAVSDDNGSMEYFYRFDNGGCAGMAAYATLKIFHNPYVVGSAFYRQIGKTVSANNIAAIRKMLKKAKIGDVLRWQSGSELKHVAIILSVNNSGVKFYEARWHANSKVFDNTFVTYGRLGHFASAKTLSLHRSQNYEKVNAGKAAKNFSRGKEFTWDGITYKVTKAGIRGAQVKVVSKTEDAGKTPKGIGVNLDYSEMLIDYGEKNDDASAVSDGEKLRFRTYNKVKKHHTDEQFFTVKQ